MTSMDNIEIIKAHIYYDDKEPIGMIFNIGDTEIDMFCLHKTEINSIIDAIIDYKDKVHIGTRYDGGNYIEIDENNITIGLLAISCCGSCMKITKPKNMFLSLFKKLLEELSN